MKEPFETGQHINLMVRSLAERPTRQVLVPPSGAEGLTAPIYNLPFP
jgi:hypothetical protein